ncbi:hypothetical protein FQN57_001674 [Myotisia sp. PD_48]|nr:hypothetical protein FQN57_001674 [Myotisia sp. PD_48]
MVVVAAGNQGQTTQVTGPIVSYVGVANHVISIAKLAIMNGHDDQDANTDASHEFLTVSDTRNDAIEDGEEDDRDSCNNSSSIRLFPDKTDEYEHGDLDLHQLTQRTAGTMLPSPPLSIHRATLNDDADIETPSQNVSHPSPPGLSSGETKENDKDASNKVLKLSPAKLHELTSSPDSLCLHTVPTDPSGLPERRRSETLPTATTPLSVEDSGSVFPLNEDDESRPDADMGVIINGTLLKERRGIRRRRSSSGKHVYLDKAPEFLGRDVYNASNQAPPVTTAGRQRSATSNPVISPNSTTRRHSANSRPKQERRGSAKLESDANSSKRSIPAANRSVSPVPASIPIPPFSIPTYLQLELSSERPSPLYIHRSGANEFPYESSRAKLERLQNFFLLPPLLEQVLCFGTLACLDSWLYTFTILPLRFFKAIFILLRSWAVNLGREIRFVASYIVKGLGRMWRRQSKYSSVDNSNPGHQEDEQTSRGPTTLPSLPDVFTTDGTRTHDKGDSKPQPTDLGKNVHEKRRRLSAVARHHRRMGSIPSTLLPSHKADILKGLLMICTCTILMYFDASRMYHWIRGQAAIKLYVIYNVLEVGDRLLSAIGQDVLECLFSQEALERGPDGRSKVLRPFWMFILALTYTVIHATALFYQVMTLNVAVNSYSNALITLLLSNQFVEIKSTVFKKFEKENLFQLTCADVVERFQLWLMLIIIASRNFVETGGFNFGTAFTFARSDSAVNTNSTPPLRSASSILPQSFTLLFPSSVLSSLSSMDSFLPALGHLLAPFLVVLGSEMIVDWLKHAYISKFNNYRPTMYGRFLDILAKDYYTGAFSDQDLNRRLGLPLIPLACLFFRVSIQTYQMFLTAWLPELSYADLTPTPSNATSLTAIHSHYSPIPETTTTFFPQSASSLFSSSYLQSLIPLAPFAHLTSWLSQILAFFSAPSPVSFTTVLTIILLLLIYVTLLLAKLVLGMILLGYSRARYKNMKYRERENAASLQSSYRKPPSSAFVNPDVVEGGRRFGGWGAIEVGDDRRRWIYADDPEGARKLREREKNVKPNGAGSGAHGIENVRRYEMIAKRIW